DFVVVLPTQLVRPRYYPIILFSGHPPPRHNLISADIASQYSAQLLGIDHKPLTISSLRSRSRPVRMTAGRRITAAFYGGIRAPVVVVPNPPRRHADNHEIAGFIRCIDPYSSAVVALHPFQPITNALDRIGVPARPLVITAPASWP